MKLLEIYNEIITEAVLSDEVYVIPPNFKGEYWDVNTKKYTPFNFKKPVFFNFIGNTKTKRPNKTYWNFAYKSITDDKIYNIVTKNSIVNNRNVVFIKDIRNLNANEVSNYILSYNWSPIEFNRIIENNNIKDILDNLNNKKINNKIQQFEDDKRKNPYFLEPNQNPDIVNTNQSQRNKFFPKRNEMVTSSNGKNTIKAKGYEANLVRATDKAEKALSNVGFSNTTIGKPSVPNEKLGLLKFSTQDNLVSKIGMYQQVEKTVLDTIKSLMIQTKSDFTEYRDYITINVLTVSNQDLFYDVKDSDSFYWGKSNTLSKFFIPNTVNNIRLKNLENDDISMLSKHNIMDNKYKKYEYKLIIRK
jgi:hypothetical protein